MNRRNALAIALVLALAAVAALVATARTTQLGAAAAAPKAPSAQIAQRNAQLDRAEAALRRALHKRQPALPKVPVIPRSAAMAVAHGASAAPVAAAPQQAIIYVRPAPIVRIAPRSGEHETEHEDHHESEHEGADD